MLNNPVVAKRTTKYISSSESEVEVRTPIYLKSKIKVQKNPKVQVDEKITNLKKNQVKLQYIGEKPKRAR